MKNNLKSALAFFFLFFLHGFSIGTRQNYFCSTQIQNIVLWNDDILIYGVWDSLPNWKILKKYYERTWWYKKTIQQKRNIIITQIQNG